MALCVTSGNVEIAQQLHVESVLEIHAFTRLFMMFSPLEIVHDVAANHELESQCASLVHGGSALTVHMLILHHTLHLLWSLVRFFFLVGFRS